MSRNHNRNQRQEPKNNAAGPANVVAIKGPATITDAEFQLPREEPRNAPVEVEAYRRCPICWGERGGHCAGKANTRTDTFDVSRPYVTRAFVYLKCNASTKAEWGGCGWTWKTIKTTTYTEVQHRDVDLSVRSDIGS